LERNPFNNALFAAVKLEITVGRWNIQRKQRKTLIRFLFLKTVFASKKIKIKK